MLRFLLVIVLLLIPAVSYGDEVVVDGVKVELESKQALQAVETYQTSTHTLQTLVRARTATLREDLLKAFRRELSELTAAGKLDAAIQLRDAITALEATVTAAEAIPQAASKFPVGKRPSKLVRFKGSQYALIPIEKTWSQCRDHAHAMGGHLLHIDSEEEWVFIRNWLAQQAPIPHSSLRGKPHLNVYVDGRQDGDGFYDSNHKPYQKVPWAKDQPATLDPGWSGCLVIAMTDGTFYNVYPMVRPYICEWEDK